MLELLRNPFIAIGLIVAVIFIICLIGVIVYKSISTKIEKNSLASLPEGSDSSEIGKMLQDKYKAERDNGEFNRNF